LSTSDPAVPSPRSGLLNVADIIIAPNAAFDRLRQVPTWFWAFLVASLLAIAGSLLAQPGMQHALEVSLPAQLAADPNMAKLPPERQQTQIAAVMKTMHVMTQIGWILVPFAILITGVIQALILTVANAIAKGDGDFKKFFALSVTVSVVGTGLYTIVYALIVLVRGPSAFESMTALQTAVPGLGLLVPGAHGWLSGFLGAFNIFFLWASALLAFGAMRVGRVSPGAAWSASIVVLVFYALFAAFGARNG
jgi:Yip1 domain